MDLHVKDPLTKTLSAELVIKNKMNALKHDVEKNGIAICSNVGLLQESIDATKQNLLHFLRPFGTPLPHNDNTDTLTWDIKPDAKPTGGYITHSQLSDEAYFHTDSSFSEDPEDLFCLYTLKPSLEGGESFFLHLDEILKALRSSNAGRHVESVLRTKRYPFTIPQVFKKQYDNKGYTLAYILEQETIRYRDDVINFEISQNPSIVDQEQKDALAFLKSCIDQAHNKCTIKLEADDLVLVDNKTVLHGRTAFTDKSRHLVRVRIRR